MLKKLSLSLLFCTLALSLVGCNDNKKVSKTGIAECDQYIDQINKIAEKIPDSQKELYKNSLNEFEKIAKQDPEKAKQGCKIGLNALEKAFQLH